MLLDGAVSFTTNGVIRLGFMGDLQPFKPKEMNLEDPGYDDGEEDQSEASTQMWVTIGYLLAMQCHFSGHRSVSICKVLLLFRGLAVVLLVFAKYHFVLFYICCSYFSDTALLFWHAGRQSAWQYVAVVISFIFDWLILFKLRWVIFIQLNSIVGLIPELESLIRMLDVPLGLSHLFNI